MKCPSLVNSAGKIFLLLVLSGCGTSNLSDQYKVAAIDKRVQICEQGALIKSDFASSIQGQSSVNSIETNVLNDALFNNYSIKPRFGSLLGGATSLKSKLKSRARIAGRNNRFYVGSGDIEFQLDDLSIENIEVVREIAFSIATLKAKREIAAQLNISVSSRDETRTTNTGSTIERVASTSVATNLFGISTVGINESMPSGGNPYQLAVVLAWSPRLEILARGSLLGCFETVKFRDMREKGERLIKNGKMGLLVGSRTLFSEDGHPWAFSLGAHNVDRSQGSLKRGMIFSREIALKRVTTNLVGAVSSRSASSKQLEKNSKDLVLATSMSIEMEAFISRLFVPGVKLISEGIVESNEGVGNKYYSAYSIDPSSIKYDKILLKQYFPGLSDLSVEEIIGSAGS